MSDRWASPEETSLAQQGETRKPTVAFYEPAKKVYWIENAAGSWIEVTETSLRRLLKQEGLNPKPTNNQFVSELDARLIKIQRESCVSYAAPLAGYKTGPQMMCGNLVLVTDAPKFIEPIPGEWPTLTAVFENLFVDGDIDQRIYFFGWLKIGYEALRSGQRRPGQALVLAGEHDCGKSLLQNIITEIFGGRVAKPFRYMSGGSAFNGELFCAEHLAIEDEFASTNIAARRKLGASIKEFTVNQVQSCHPKQRQAISLEPFWRVTISVNSEPENLMILPPLEESLSDKIMLLKACKKPMPMPTTTPAERKTFWDKLLAELPAFLDYLCKLEIPQDLRSARFGIREFHHPELLEAIDGLAPETRLLSLIDTAIFGDTQIGHLAVKPTEEWAGTAERLESTLRSHSETHDEATRLLNWPNATGTYLGRLAKKCPKRVQSVRTSHRREWRILPALASPP
jgi:hypothetical protein